MKHTMPSVTTHVKDKYPQFVYIEFSDVFVLRQCKVTRMEYVRPRADVS